jgi:hypothetical protein
VGLGRWDLLKEEEVSVGKGEGREDDNKEQRVRAHAQRMKMRQTEQETMRTFSSRTHETKTPKQKDNKN